MAIRFDEKSSLHRIEKVGNNSDNLLASATYTSSSFFCGSSSHVLVTITSSHAGTLKVEFSWDNSNYDAEVEYTYNANDKLGVAVSTIAPYCRVQYVNGATNQTSFRIYWGKKS